MVYSVLTVVLVVLVASLAFTARQPPPPQIAELTPQAQHQITKAPNQLGSSVGSATGGQCSGSGACGAGASPGGGPGATHPPTTAPAATPAPVAAAAVHHCYGNPPRQISFDTQSPPCVAFWAGNNGGATARGVTGDEIKVAVNTSVSSQVLADMASFFNRTFEFYGRDLVLEPTNASTGDGSCSSADAAADGVVASFQPFAATDADTGGDGCFLAEMARDKVVTVSQGESAFFSSSEMDAEAPYLYQYPMAADQEMAVVGRMVCAQLAGRRASYSPDPTIASQVRTFGLIVAFDASIQAAYDTNPLSDQLARCGVRLAASTAYHDNLNTQQRAQDYATWSQEAILSMKEHHVTTVICLCAVFDGTDLPSAADSEDYHPEWILAMGDFDWDQVVEEWWPDPDQRVALMGLTFFPAQVPYPDMTVTQAMRSVDPGYQNQTGGDTLNQLLYWNLLELASGVQMAGPDLTPYSFQRGLQLTHFPNPWSPEMEGAVGFNGGSHAMTTDAAAMWWSNTAPSPYPDEGAGGWCYVDGGNRWNLTDWPTGTPQFFKAPCHPSPVQ